MSPLLIAGPLSTSHASANVVGEWSRSSNSNEVVLYAKAMFVSTPLVVLDFSHERDREAGRGTHAPRRAR